MLERFLSSDAVEFNVLQEDLVYLLERVDQQRGSGEAPLARSA
jgi:hypothetical protein